MHVHPRFTRFINRQLWCGKFHLEKRKCLGQLKGQQRLSYGSTFDGRMVLHDVSMYCILCKKLFCAVHGKCVKFILNKLFKFLIQFQWIKTE